MNTIFGRICEHKAKQNMFMGDKLYQLPRYAFPKRPYDKLVCGNHVFQAPSLLKQSFGIGKYGLPIVVSSHHQPKTKGGVRLTRISLPPQT
ncbi:MAG: hypothetical protein E5X26_06010 [Mesorhizobium sp.]|nr:MAG: hypothetical protein E5X26_06010 [Mesorhizobium sp.]